MFEKEAEEYANDMAMYYESAHDSVPSQFEKYMRKAAMFGYNKAKVEVEIEQWHILAENPKDVPAENSVVKVLTEDNIIQESTYFYDDYFEEMAFSNVGLVKVLAWKEIVPPKEI